MKYLVLVVLFIPIITLAQNGSLQSLLTGIGGFFNEILIPFILAIAFLIFVVNVIRFFIIQGDNDDGQKNAKHLAVYSVSAFVFILSFWGIVNLLTDGIGFDTDPCTNYTISDYVIDDKVHPCTVVRPKPRPDGLVQPEVDTNSPSPMTTPTGTPSPAPLPNPSTPPSPSPLPGPLTPPNTPDTPLPAQPTPSVAEMSLLIRKAGTEFYNTKMPELFGQNVEAIAKTLLADFYTTENNTVSNQDRATAAYRLKGLGAISDTTFNNFIKSLNQAEIDKGTLIRYDEKTISSLVAKPTDNIVNSNAQKTIEDLKSIGATDDDIIFLQSNDSTPQKTAEKLKNFEWFYNSGLASGDGSKTPADYDTDGKVKDRYIADINTAALFSGNFNFVGVSTTIKKH